MFLRRTMSLAGPIVCTLCLMVGQATNGWAIAVMAGVSTGLAWWFANKRPTTSLPLAALVISIGWSAAGLLAKAPALLMILSATFALASWDLVLFDHILVENPISSTSTIALFQNRHYRGLALALGLGLLIVFVGRTIQLQISFVLIGLFVLLALFSVDRIWHALKA